LNIVNLLRHISSVLAFLYMMIAASVCAGETLRIWTNDTSAESAPILKPGNPGIWITGVGEGFRSRTQVLGFNAGVAYGVLIFGGEERHHLSLLSASYGRMIGGVKGADSWYRGNVELRGEIFGGVQFNSETCSLIGVTPHVRYHFATSTPWVPYIDFGVGITSTSIRAPDLGDSFEFNLQAVVGVNYFIRDALAINFEGRYLHLSSAGIYNPNNGVNTIGIFLGVSTFF
jgi:lipid A 3-O-deacylase